MKSDLHQQLQNKAQLYLMNKGFWICGQEVPMPVGVCDAWGLNHSSGFAGYSTSLEGRKVETRVFDCMAIEVKVSRSDFRSRSQKYKEASDFPLGNFQYVLCPAGMIQPDECHAEWGLLWWTGERIVNKKKAPRLDMTAEEKLRVLIYFLNNGFNEKRPLLQPLPEQAALLL